jgi:hypothetical protein
LLKTEEKKNLHEIEMKLLQEKMNEEVNLEIIQDQLREEIRWHSSQKGCLGVA